MTRSTFSIKRPIATGMLFLALIVFGLKSYQELSLNLLPDISYPTLTVRTKYPGAAPEEVENLPSIPIEEALGTVGGLVKMSSISSSGLSEVILEFDWKTDMDMASLDVREKLDRVNLPDEVEKSIILRYNPSLDPIIRFGLYGSDDLFRLRKIGDDVVKKEIEGIAGVAAVKVKGGLEEEILIRIDEKRVASIGLSVEEIGNRLRLENVNLAGGSLREGRAEYLVRTMNEFQTVEDIANTIIGEQNSADIKLSDIATVKRSHKERDIITRINGRESVEIEIYKEADSNTVRVADAVKQKLGMEMKPSVEANTDKQQSEAVPDKDGSIEASADKQEPKAVSAKARLRRSKKVVDQLPPGIKLETVSDQSEFIKRAIDEVKSTALLGGVLALIVLYLFLRDFRSTVMIGLAIPISIMATFLPMFIAKVSINIMSLGGLALGVGMLVDNSIVVLESIYRCREDGDSLVEAASRGLLEVRGAVIASTITTIAVFFPIVFVRGIASQIFTDLALTVTFALFSSLLVALFLNPMLVSREYKISEQWLGGRGAPRPGLKAARDWIKQEWARIPFASALRLITGRKDATRQSEPDWDQPVKAGLIRTIIRFVFGPPVAVVMILLSLISFSLKVLAQAVFVVFIAALYIVLSVVGLLWKVGAIVARFITYPILAVFNKTYSALAAGYLVLLKGALANRLPVIAIAAALLGHCVYLAPRLGSELMPKIHEGRFGIIADKAVGTPIEMMEASILPIEETALAHPLVKTIFSLIGSESSSAEAKDLRGSNVAQFDVALKDMGSDVYVQDAVMESLRKDLAKLTDMKIKFVESSPFTFRTSVEVEIEGRDLDLLKEIGGEIETLIAGVPGLKDVRLNIERGTPEMHISFNSEKIAALGMTVNEVAESVRRKVKGDVPTRLARGDEKIDIRIKASDADIRTVDAIKNLVVNPRGSIPIPLSAVSDISVSPGPSEIMRIDQRRVALITANLASRDLGGISREIQERVKKVMLPRGYTIAIGGQFEEMQTSSASLRLALLLAVFLVYAVMAAQFESLVHPLIIIFSIPLAFIGVIYVLYILGIPISVVVFMGGIVLAGIVVNDAIVLVDYINHLRSTGLSINEAVVKACQTRLRPVLMTTMTTILGLTPMAIGLGEGSEVRVPLAVTVIAGLLSATFLTLIVIPLIYSVVSREGSGVPNTNSQGKGLSPD